MKLKKILAVLLALVCVFTLVACGNQSENQTTTTTSPEPKEGKTVEGKSVFNNIDYTVYIPSSYNENEKAPLIMALHGGGQGTAIPDKTVRGLFADFTGLNAYADKYGFIVVYPRQATTNHFYGVDYWNWYTQQNRTDAEPKALYDIVCEVKGEYNVDESNVFVCGFSAGAAMAEIVAVTYPEVFAGCCVLAGVSYKACEAKDTLVVQTAGPTKSNDELAQEINTAMGSNTQPKKMLVITGTDDSMVNPKNSLAIAQSWAVAMKTVDDSVDTQVKSETATGVNNVEYTKSVYATLGGEELCTLYEISSMGHQWPGAVAGVSTDSVFGNDFAFDGGINLSEVMCHFFGLDK